MKSKEDKHLFYWRLVEVELIELYKKNGDDRERGGLARSGGGERQLDAPSGGGQLAHELDLAGVQFDPVGRRPEQGERHGLLRVDMTPKSNHLRLIFALNLYPSRSHAQVQ